MSPLLRWTLHSAPLLRALVRQSNNYLKIRQVLVVANLLYSVVFILIQEPAAYGIFADFYRVRFNSALIITSLMKSFFSVSILVAGQDIYNASSTDHLAHRNFARYDCTKSIDCSHLSYGAWKGCCWLVGLYNSSLLLFPDLVREAGLSHSTRFLGSDYSRMHPAHLSYWGKTIFWKFHK